MKKRKQPKFKPGDLVYAGSGPSGIYKRRSPERVLLGHVVQVLPRGRVVIEMLNSPGKNLCTDPLTRRRPSSMLPGMAKQDNQKTT